MSIADKLDPFRFYIRLALYLIAAALLVWAFLAVRSWDRGRLQARYDAGVAAERAVWTEAQAKASRIARERTQAAQAASEGATDTARAGAATDAAARDQATQETVDTITRGHADAPPPRCTPDSGHAPLPRSVLDALDQARGRAGGARAAAPGRLPAAPAGGRAGASADG